MRVRAFIAFLAVPLLLWAALPLVSSGAPSARTASTLQKKIETKRGQIEQKRGRERVLSTHISAYSSRIVSLQADISRLQRRQNAIQVDLDAKRAELARIQEALRHERARLARLRARLIAGRRILAERLRDIYKTGEPDVITVILQSDGFAELLENGEFLRRINQQDARIIRTVRQAKAQAKRAAARLAKLETRQQRITAVILAERDEVASVKGRLDNRRAGFSRARDGKSALLSQVKTSRAHLEEDLDALEAESAKVQAKLQGVSPGAAGPIRRGSGQLIWPVNGPVTGSFGEARPGHMHAGLDIAAPNGTPIRAADSGRVVLLGWTGGYGNYTCIQHTSSMSTCYAHQSGYATSNGASVSQGQVIGYVGNTGHSFGAHLHFEVRINGSPVSPLAYL